MLYKYGMRIRNFYRLFYFISVFYILRAFLLKQLFYPRLLDLRDEYSQLNYAPYWLAIYQLISNARSWDNC